MLYPSNTLKNIKWTCIVVKIRQFLCEERKIFHSRWNYNPNTRPEFIICDIVIGAPGFIFDRVIFYRPAPISYTPPSNINNPKIAIGREEDWNETQSPQRSQKLGESIWLSNSDPIWSLQEDDSHAFNRNVRQGNIVASWTS